MGIFACRPYRTPSFGKTQRPPVPIARARYRYRSGPRPGKSARTRAQFIFSTHQLPCPARLRLAAPQRPFSAEQVQYPHRWWRAAFLQLFSSHNRGGAETDEHWAGARPPLGIAIKKHQQKKKAWCVVPTVGRRRASSNLTH